MLKIEDVTVLHWLGKLDEEFISIKTAALLLIFIRNEDTAFTVDDVVKKMTMFPEATYGSTKDVILSLVSHKFLVEYKAANGNHQYSLGKFEEIKTRNPNLMISK